jgi:flagellar protein FliO/FliZ
MDFLDLIRAVAALAVTLGLVGLAAVAMRRFGPEWMQRLQTVATKRDRRLVLVETLGLDPTRRLVLVSLDGQERLILLGEGHLLEAGVATPVRSTSAKVRAVQSRSPKTGIVS